MSKYRIVKITNNNDDTKYALQKRKFIFFWFYFKRVWGFDFTLVRNIIYYDTEESAKKKVGYLVNLDNENIIKSKEYLNI